LGAAWNYFTLGNLYRENQLLASYSRSVFARTNPEQFYIGGTVKYLSRSIGATAEAGSGYRVRRVAKENNGQVSRYDLVPNRYHVGGEPYIRSFSLLVYGNQEELERAYRMHSINGFSVAGPLNDSTPRGKITSFPMSRYYAVFFNTNAKNVLMRDKDARIALDRALPRERIVREVFNNQARIIAHPVLSRESVDVSNIETARELFAKTGIKNPSLTLIVPRTPFLEKTANIIKEEWEKLGVRITLEVKDSKEIFETDMKDGSYEAILFGNILQNQDDLFSFWHSSQEGYPGLNLSFFSTENTDRLLENIRQTDNENTRNAELDSLALFLSNESPAAFLYSVPLVFVHESRLEGLENKKALSSPAERFSGVTQWFVQKARVLR
jgi:peptide/nickel transport system substrate-binding protein